MSRSDAPLRPQPPPDLAGRSRGIHHEGDLLGLQYELGIRVSDLAPPGREVARRESREEGAGGAPEAREALGRWESEGGTAPADDGGR